ncbi:hypothetical protein GP486_005747 [Trichoglossum hirsutum]|uniref:Uncharacterized protein n=1 Tax=Trichoglossum hirsutum TaxID=265104 RepID=A0A9P8RLN9_9PEZI|nr:hypothetical protein GP486_005747 [Trichoglossum hirsutum]
MRQLSLMQPAFDNDFTVSCQDKMSESKIEELGEGKTVELNLTSGEKELDKGKTVESSLTSGEEELGKGKTVRLSELGKVGLSLIPGGGKLTSMDSQKMAQYTNTSLNINVYCEYEVHGFLDGDQKNPASLLVLQYQLGGEMTDRRFTAFRPRLTFQAAETLADVDKEPWVTDCIYPGVATTVFYEVSADEIEELTKSLSGQLAGPNLSASQIAAALKKVSTEHWTKKYRYRIKASLSEKDPDRRKKDDQIRWEAWQEKEAQVGIDIIQVAMVVRRHEGYDLRVTMEFDADVDFRYKVGEKWDKYIGHQGLKRTFVFKVYDGVETRDGTVQPKLKETNVPTGVDRNHLRKMEGESKGLFEALGWAHVVEAQTPKKYYIGEAPPKDFQVEPPPTGDRATGIKNKVS